jgi:CHAT domain-containing protein
MDGKANIHDTHLVLKDLTSNKLFNEIAWDNWLQPYYNRFSTGSKTDWHDTIENTAKLLSENFWYANDENGKSLAQLVENSDAERILFIPHSGLHLLPLHLMPIQKDMRLMDKYEISYAPSVSLLKFALQREREFDNLFAVANPDRSLPFTDNEVKEITKQFQKCNKGLQPLVLWYEDATQDAVIGKSKGAEAVHFSCHGAFQYGNPMDSRLLLANDEVLTLTEIFAKMKLPKAGAVVLSACETGMVKLDRGDEFIGLPSGFLYAGAPTVISSLWAVSDISTSFLMSRWYENVLQKNMGKAKALQEAQQWLRNLTNKELYAYFKNGDFEEEIVRSAKRKAKHFPDAKPFEHPYYWGAFVCTGKWD